MMHAVEAPPAPVERWLGARPLSLVNDRPAILCEDVVKRFHHYERRQDTLRELFVRTLLRRPARRVRADFSLRGFSLRVEKGESVALVGTNGSGKSTALRLIAGIYQPTAGRVITHGRVTAIIDLGVGFHPDLTGLENVIQYAAALGLSRRETNARIEEILDFADIGAFVHEPLRVYSTGMKARLAFAGAIICSQPDILLIDEVLSVGDRAFQAKCLQRLREFQDDGGTLLLVSHDSEILAELCSRAVWLEGGRVRLSGSAAEVLAAYHAEPAPAQLTLDVS